MLLLIALCTTYVATRHGVLVSPSAAREGAATQQLQQQQPATRHSATERRLGSMSSTRADTPCSLPNADVMKPTAASGPTAGHRLSAPLTRDNAGGRRRRR